jgi:hypothetical protein
MSSSIAATARNDVTATSGADHDTRQGHDERLVSFRCDIEPINAR